MCGCMGLMGLWSNWVEMSTLLILSKRHILDLIFRNPKIIIKNSIIGLPSSSVPGFIGLCSYIIILH